MAELIEPGYTELDAQLDREEDFSLSFDAITNDVYENANNKGFHDNERSFGDCVSLIISELGEAVEAHRHQNPPSEKIDGFSSIEEELADVVIRVMDTAGYRGFNLGDAIIAKMRFNRGREKMHGGKIL